MKAKFAVALLVLTVTAGLSGCATPPYPPPHSATDCAFAMPLPRYWPSGTSESCQNFRPYPYHHHYHHRHHRR
jgi:hypothetical protein